MEKKTYRRMVDLDTSELIEVKEGEVLQIVAAEPEEKRKSRITNQKVYGDIKDFSDQIGGFIFVMFQYADIFLKEHPSVKTEDIAKLFYLATLMNYNGMVRGNPVKIAEKLGIDRTTYKAFYGRMQKAGVLQEVDGGVMVNPECFTKGKNKNPPKDMSKARAYIESIKYVYENISITSHVYLGTLFKLLPFINHQHNVLCCNPHETDKKKIKYVTLGDLVDLLGVGETTMRIIKKELLSLRMKNGKGVFMGFIGDPDERKMFFIVNPQFIYGGTLQDEDSRRRFSDIFDMQFAIDNQTKKLEDKK